MDITLVLSDANETFADEDDGGAGGSADGTWDVDDVDEDAPEVEGRDEDEDVEHADGVMR